MIKKQFKNHIMYEIGENDIVSNLGINSIVRRNEYMLPVREIVYNGKKNVICSTERFTKENISVADDNRTVIMIKSLATLMELCIDSAFLDCSYIDLSGEVVFYDRKENTYRFPVIPVENTDRINERGEWSQNCKNYIISLLKTINSNDSLSKFKNGLMQTSDVATFVVEEAPFLISNGQKIKMNDSNLELTYAGKYGSFTLFICKDEFVVGKEKDCDGALTMNPTISRHHCRFKRTGDGWLVEDLGSSNGTYLGNTHIRAGELMPIKEGDVIRIADMDFSAHIV